MPKFEKGVSGNPRGRPRGGEDRRSALRKQLCERVPEIVDVVVDAALAGDLSACKLLLDKTVPSLRPVDQPIRLRTPEMDSVTEALASGELTPDQAVQAASALLTAWRIRELSEFEQRLCALEARHAQEP